MLRESNEITEAIIQLIQSLSEPQQKKIVKTISSGKRRKDGTKKSYREKAEALIADMKKTRGRLPSNYRFDREEANERRFIKPA